MGGVKLNGRFHLSIEEEFLNPSLNVTCGQFVSCLAVYEPGDVGEVVAASVQLAGEEGGVALYLLPPPCQAHGAGRACSGK